MTSLLSPRLLAVWVVLASIGTTAVKGSESHEISNEESSTNEESKTSEEKGEKYVEKNKKTGAQQKFWIPTYPGTNPLNRRKIEITNSEIERFDSSIDESISGVIRNASRPRRLKDKNLNEREKDLSKIPFAWSGDDMNHNVTVHDLASLDSSLVTVESERSNKHESTELKKNYSPFAWDSNRFDSSTAKSSDESGSYSSKSSSEESATKRTRLRNKGKVKNTAVYTTSEPNLEKVSSGTRRTMTKNKESNKHKIEENKLKLERKQKKTPDVSYSPEKITDDNLMSRDYYKKMVEAAVENTKRKLGYQKQTKTKSGQPPHTFRPIIPDSLNIDSKGSEPEIFKVNIDSKSYEKIKTEEEIHFETRHGQFSTLSPQSKTTKSQKKEKSEVKKERIKALSEELEGKPKGMNFKLNYTESELDKIYKKQRATDFPSSCDYEAWSDVLLKNRTQRKSKQRKPKTGKLSNSYERSSGDMRAWPGKKIKEKAEELRKKEGKLTRKEKRKRAQKKIEKKRKEKTSKGEVKEKYIKDYQHFTGADKYSSTNEELDYDYDFKGSAYSYDDSPKKGRKKSNYDYSSEEKDIYNSSEQEKRKTVKKKNFDDKKDYGSDKPRKKFRMTTTGEKRHAYKEVKTYLKEMDKEYGGRPGGETYNERKEGRGFDRKDYRDKGRGWDKRGNDRGKFRGGRSERGGFDRGRENWGERDRRGGDNWRGGRWERGGREKGRDTRGGDNWRGGRWERGGREKGRDTRGGDNWRGGRWERGGREKGRDRRGRERDDRGDMGGGGRGGQRNTGRGGGWRGRGGRGRGRGRGGGSRRG